MIRDFFEDHSLRAVIDACLEGMAGEIQTVGTQPAAARLDVGCYAIFGGDPDTDEALHLIQSTRQGQEMVFADRHWQQRIRGVHPGAREGTMITFLPGRNQSAIAQRLAAEPPAEVQIRPLAKQESLPESLTPNGFQVFEDPSAFHRHGFGLVAISEGAIIAQTTSYTVSSDKVEIAIATSAGQRNKGLATALATRMVLACEDRQLTPYWSASNPISQRLARRIGFVDDGLCQFLTVA